MKILGSVKILCSRIADFSCKSTGIGLVGFADRSVIKSISELEITGLSIQQKEKCSGGKLMKGGLVLYFPALNRSSETLQATADKLTELTGVKFSVNLNRIEGKVSGRQAGRYNLIYSNFYNNSDAINGVIETLKSSPTVKIAELMTPERALNGEGNEHRQRLEKTAVSYFGASFAKPS